MSEEESHLVTPTPPPPSSFNCHRAVTDFFWDTATIATKRDTSRANARSPALPSLATDAAKKDTSLGTHEGSPRYDQSNTNSECPEQPAGGMGGGMGGGWGGPAGGAGGSECYKQVTFLSLRILANSQKVWRSWSLRSVSPT